MHDVSCWGVESEVIRVLLDRKRSSLTVLVETDLVSALTEALTADVEAVLSDDTALVTADTAVESKKYATRGSRKVSTLPAKTSRHG